MKKVFWKGSDGLCLMRWDKLNYAIATAEGEGTWKDDTTYHQDLAAAIRRLSRIDADEHAYDFESWLQRYEKTNEYYKEFFDGVNI